MRTTIELSEVHRAILLKLAADRGEKGFSRLIGEAIDAYLAGTDVGDERTRAQKLRGALSDEASSELEARVKALREDWR